MTVKVNPNSDKKFQMWADITHMDSLNIKFVLERWSEEKVQDDRNSFVQWEEERPFREMELVKAQRRDDPIKTVLRCFSRGLIEPKRE